VARGAQVVWFPALVCMKGVTFFAQIPPDWLPAMRCRAAESKGDIQ
jgi:hypothetical protein